VLLQHSLMLLGDGKCLAEGGGARVRPAVEGGEGPGPGEKGAPWPSELSKEFSLLCTLGLLLPIVGGFQKEAGRLRIRSGTCR